MSDPNADARINAVPHDSPRDPWAPIRFAMRVQAIALVAFLIVSILISVLMPEPLRPTGIPVAPRKSDVELLNSTVTTLQDLYSVIVILLGGLIASGVFVLCFSPDVVAARRARLTAYFVGGFIALCAVTAYFKAFHRLLIEFPPQIGSVDEMVFFFLFVVMDLGSFIGWVKTLSAIGAAFGNRRVASVGNAVIVAAILASLPPWIVHYQSLVPLRSGGFELQTARWVSLLVTLSGAIALLWTAMRATRKRGALE